MHGLWIRKLSIVIVFLNLEKEDHVPNISRACAFLKFDF